MHVPLLGPVNNRVLHVVRIYILQARCLCHVIASLVLFDRDNHPTFQMRTLRRGPRDTAIMNVVGKNKDRTAVQRWGPWSQLCS